MLRAYCEAKMRKEELADEILVDVWCRTQRPLEGAELGEYHRQQESRKAQRAKQQQEQELLAQVQVAKGQLRLEEEETLVGGAKAGSSDKRQLSAQARTRPRKKSRFDQKLFLKFSKPLYSKCTWRSGFAVCYSWPHTSLFLLSVVPDS